MNNDYCNECGEPIEVLPGIYQANRCDKHRKEAFSL